MYMVPVVESISMLSVTREYYEASYFSPEYVKSLQLGGPQL